MDDLVDPEGVNAGSADALSDNGKHSGGRRGGRPDEADQQQPEAAPPVLDSPPVPGPGQEQQVGEA